MRWENAIVTEDTITISKADLVAARQHYCKVADERKPSRKKESEWLHGFYIGKSDVLTEMLKEFDRSRFEAY